MIEITDADVVRNLSWMEIWPLRDRPPLKVGPIGENGPTVHAITINVATAQATLKLSGRMTRREVLARGHLFGAIIESTYGVGGGYTPTPRPTECLISNDMELRVHSDFLLK